MERAKWHLILSWFGEGDNFFLVTVNLCSLFVLNVPGVTRESHMDRLCVLSFSYTSAQWLVKSDWTPQGELDTSVQIKISFGSYSYNKMVTNKTVKQKQLQICKNTTIFKIIKIDS